MRFRIKQGLIKGKAKHSSGTKIRANEDTARIEVRWAAAERSAAAEDEPHRRYINKPGGLPKYTDHT